MCAMDYGMFIRSQYNTGDDMVARFDELMEQARLAEKLGFASLLKGSHYAGAPLQEFQQLPFLSRVMTECPSLRLITGIVLLSLHKPLDIAEQLATIDVMSNGKLTFGAGLGYREVEFQGFGTTQSDRVQRFEENLEAVIRLWTEDKVEHRGEHFTVGGLSASIRPKQAGGPPIWVGGEIPPAVRRAARLGCPWVIPPTMHWDDAVHRLGVYKAAMGEAGTSNPHGQPLIREVVIGATREAAMAAAGPHLLAKYESYASWGQTAASEGSLADRFDEFCAKRFIIGDEAEVEDEMARYRDEMGVDHFLVRLQWPGFEQKGVVDAVERIGRVAARLG